MDNLTRHSDYKHVPPLSKDDNVLPAALDIPSMLSAIRNPRRRRISVGPQSEADAREYLANREHRRQASRSRSRPKKEQGRLPSTAEDPPSPESEVPNQPGSDIKQNASIESTASLQVNALKPALLTPPASDADAQSDSGKEDERKDREMFSALEKPRIRYDAEVITKLIVYAGMFLPLILI